MIQNMMRKAMVSGDGSTLSLDFTTGVLDPLITFTRSTTGTYINSSGYVTSAAINAPRFDYDPTTLAPRGLLIEGSASNYGTYSESFATSGSGTLWTYSAITKNATLASSPAGNNDAAQFNETTANDIHRISQSLSAAAGSVTISVWAKAIDPATPRRLFMNALGFMGCGALFDLDPAVQTGASGNAVNVAGSAANRAGTWVKYPNGWYRCSIVGTYNTGATVYLQVNRASSTVATDDTYAGSTTNGLMLYGFQVELGSGASSYIPTGASTGTRAADDCLLDNISTAFGFNASEGTILIKYGNRISTGSMRSYTFLPASGAANQMFETAGVALNVYSSGSFTAQIGSTNASAARVCAAYKVNDFAASVNGGAVSTDTSGALATSLTRLSIGGTIVNPAGYNFGPISSFKYWPTRLPDAQLQVLST